MNLQGRSYDQLNEISASTEPQETSLSKKNSISLEIDLDNETGSQGRGFSLLVSDKLKEDQMYRYYFLWRIISHICYCVAYGFLYLTAGNALKPIWDEESLLKLEEIKNDAHLKYLKGPNFNSYLPIGSIAVILAWQIFGLFISRKHCYLTHKRGETVLAIARLAVTVLYLGIAYAKLYQASNILLTPFSVIGIVMMTCSLNEPFAHTDETHNPFSNPLVIRLFLWMCALLVSLILDGFLHPGSSFIGFWTFLSFMACAISGIVILSVFYIRLNFLLGYQLYRERRFQEGYFKDGCFILGWCFLDFLTVPLWFFSILVNSIQYMISDCTNPKAYFIAGMVHSGLILFYALACLAKDKLISLRVGN